MDFINRFDKNELISWFYFNIREVVSWENMMETDETDDMNAKNFKDYTFSVVSIEIVKYHKDFYYLLWGTDNGYLLTFLFEPNSSKQIIRNIKSTSLGVNPVYLYPMITDNEFADSKVRL